MSKRLVLTSAEKCPFCGCTKMFLKAYLQGVWSGKRMAASVQCSSCHVNGPEVHDEYEKDHPSFERMDEQKQQDLIRQALEKWNHRA